MARLGRAQAFGPVQFGTIAAAAENELSATGVLSITGAASLNATGALLAAGSLSISGASDLDASGSLTAAGAISITGAADLDAAGLLIAAGSLSISGAADLDALGSIAAAGSLSITGAADLTGASANDIAATGILSITGSALLLALGELAASGSLVISGSAPLTSGAQPVAGGHYWPTKRKKRRDPLEERIREQREEAQQLRAQIEQALRPEVPDEPGAAPAEEPTQPAPRLPEHATRAAQIESLNAQLARTERLIERYGELAKRREQRATELAEFIQVNAEALLESIEEELTREAERLRKVLQ